MTGTDDATDVSDEPLTTIVALLDDEHVRRILTAVDGDPKSAGQLSDLCGVSETTVYRRLDRLRDAGLVEERTRPRTDGHHEAVYVATLDEVSVRLRDGRLECDVDRRRTDVADDLTRMWEGF